MCFIFLHFFLLFKWKSMRSLNMWKKCKWVRKKKIISWKLLPVVILTHKDYILVMYGIQFTKPWKTGIESKVFKTGLVLEVPPQPRVPFPALAGRSCCCLPSSSLPSRIPGCFSRSCFPAAAPSSPWCPGCRTCCASWGARWSVSRAAEVPLNSCSTLWAL